MKYGPQTSEVETLIKRARSLTDDEARGLDVAWYAARSAARYAAWYAARDAARDAAWDAAWYAARYAARDAAGYAAGDAAWALVVRDLISTDGFTQQHYDLLTKPWAQVIGPAHPDDVVPEEKP